MARQKSYPIKTFCSQKMHMSYTVLTNSLLLYIFQISKMPSFGPGWDSSSQPSDFGANTLAILPRCGKRMVFYPGGFDLEGPVHSLSD